MAGITKSSNGVRRKRLPSERILLPGTRDVCMTNACKLTSLTSEGTAPVKHPDPPPSSPVISDASDPTRDEIEGPSTPSKATTFPLDPRADKSGYAQATSQLNFDPENITPGPYEIPTAVDDADAALFGDIQADEGAGASQAERQHGFDPMPSVRFHDPMFFGDGLPTSPDHHLANNEWPDVGNPKSQDVDLPDFDLYDETLDPDVEEILRGEDEVQPPGLAYPSPSPSDSPSSIGTHGGFPVRLKEPALAPDSPEMLVAMFSRLTCGILSIKDGPNENPWRTMLLPMSADNPALRHAILSMTAFHASRQDPRFRIAGLRHSQKSLRYLGNRLETMRKDAALATTLVLAFSESWDQETSTGIRHLHAARKLVTQSATNHQQHADFDEIERLKFLRNTWVYMDVIARITTIDAEDMEDLDALFNPVYGPDGLIQELDPLMGCATTFFPLLGAVANLVREIRKNARISPRVVSRAASLRTDILKWRPPTHFHQPEDESIEIAHSIKTAEAYRWATLMFLYEAVPMIATENLGDLAERVLYDLVSVPISSRLVIVHIFPLLIAGCEMSGDDNRLLVEERWMSMTHRMTIGNLDRCLDVIHEVWKRRDQLERPIMNDDNEQAMMGRDDIDVGSNLVRHRRTLSTPASYPVVVRPDQLRRTSNEHVANIDPEVTVRGRCHWLTVMREWDWASEFSPHPPLLTMLVANC